MPLLLHNLLYSVCPSLLLAHEIFELQLLVTQASIIISISCSYLPFTSNLSVFMFMHINCSCFSTLFTTFFYCLYTFIFINLIVYSILWLYLSLTLSSSFNLPSIFPYNYYLFYCEAQQSITKLFMVFTHLSINYGRFFQIYSPIMSKIIFNSAVVTNFLLTHIY